eukprot:1986390-Prymnesium_polylepis.1
MSLGRSAVREQRHAGARELRTPDGREPSLRWPRAAGKVCRPSGRLEGGSRLSVHDGECFSRAASSSAWCRRRRCGGWCGAAPNAFHTTTCSPDSVRDAEAIETLFHQLHALRSADPPSASARGSGPRRRPRLLFRTSSCCSLLQYY